jgi:hypothetical protein
MRMIVTNHSSVAVGNGTNETVQSADSTYEVVNTECDVQDVNGNYVRSLAGVRVRYFFGVRLGCISEYPDP